MLQSGPYTSEYKVTDYTGKTERFEWSHQMKATMKSVWGIDEFRSVALARYLTKMLIGQEPNFPGYVRKVFAMPIWTAEIFYVRTELTKIYTLAHR